MKFLKDKIFKIKNDKNFEQIALQIFNYQAQKNPIYSKYLEFLGRDFQKISSITEIPFMPIEFFKNHKIITDFNSISEELIKFRSSGTSAKLYKTINQQRSTHYIKDIELYEKSFTEGFNLFYGDIKKYTFLALLPSYLERNDSSLVYMANKLIELTENSDSGFYLHNLSELAQKIRTLISKNKKIILLGVSFALLELAENFSFPKNDMIIMETGGMKGRRKELTRTELHQIFTKKLGVEKIHSEYGMTELLSQAYSLGDEVFECPPWLKIFIRDTNDPFKYLQNKRTGGINIIDLANTNSCSFIETKDLGKIVGKNKFEVLGRFDNSDIRGCNLLF